MTNPETSPERRNLETRPAIGDVVEVTWSDHFKFSANKPPKAPVWARTWGRLELENEEGIAVAQTVVIAYYPKLPVDTIHEGQFIIRSTIKGLKKLR